MTKWRLFLRTGEEILRIGTRSFAYRRKVFCVQAKANKSVPFTPRTCLIAPENTVLFPWDPRFRKHPVGYVLTEPKK